MKLFISSESYNNTIQPSISEPQNAHYNSLFSIYYANTIKKVSLKYYSLHFRRITKHIHSIQPHYNKIAKCLKISNLISV